MTSLNPGLSLLAWKLERGPTPRTSAGLARDRRTPPQPYSTPTRPRESPLQLCAQSHLPQCLCWFKRPLSQRLALSFPTCEMETQVPLCSQGEKMRRGSVGARGRSLPPQPPSPPGSVPGRWRKEQSDHGQVTFASATASPSVQEAWAACLERQATGQQPKTRTEEQDALHREAPHRWPCLDSSAGRGYQHQSRRQGTRGLSLPPGSNTGAADT